MKSARIAIISFGIFSFITPIASAACAALPTGSALIKLAGSETGMFGSTATGPFPEGSLAYDTSLKSPVYCDGTNWLTLASATTGGVVPMCMPTRQTYNGNLSGLSGADAKCATEFGSDWKFATTEKLAVAFSGTFPRDVISGWVHQPGATASSNCNDWTSTTAQTYYGLDFNGSQLNSSSNYPRTCNSSQLPVVCCNF